MMKVSRTQFIVSSTIFFSLFHFSFHIKVTWNFFSIVCNNNGNIIKSRTKMPKNYFHFLVLNFSIVKWLLFRQPRVCIRVAYSFLGWITHTWFSTTEIDEQIKYRWHGIASVFRILFVSTRSKIDNTIKLLSSLVIRIIFLFHVA